jgi:hypothetical protein
LLGPADLDAGKLHALNCRPLRVIVLIPHSALPSRGWRISS